MRKVKRTKSEMAKVFKQTINNQLIGIKVQVQLQLYLLIKCIVCSTFEVNSFHIYDIPLITEQLENKVGILILYDTV